MFKAQYKRLNSRINPDDRLVNDTISKMSALEEKQSKPIYKIRKPLLSVAIILCLCAILALTPVLAASNASIYQMMYYVSPSVAQFFVPIQKSCTYKGFELKLVSTYIHNDTAEFYVELKDLEGDRIDETVKIDFCSINSTADCSAGSQIIGYDDKTKTATFLVTINQWNGEIISGDKITFTVKEIITGNEKHLGVEVPIDLGNVSKNPETKKENVSFEDLKLQAEVLVPQKKYGEADYGRHYISATGFIDGCLHIQTATDFTADNLGHSYLYLRKKSDAVPPNLSRESNGNIHNTSGLYYAWKEGSINYDEDVFKLNADGQVFDSKIYDDYKLYGDFYTSDDAIEGLWKITFPMVNNSEQAPYSTESVAEKSEKTAYPKTKEDYYSLILNPDYSTLSGSFVSTLSENDLEMTVDYALDLENKNCYEHAEERGMDQEVYVINGNIFEYDNIHKQTGKTVRFLREDCVSAGLCWANESLYSLDIMKNTLKDFDLWKITGDIDYLDRECAIIEGVMPDELPHYGGDSFKIIIDKETGAILDIENYSFNGEINSYLHTNKFETVDVVIPNYYKSDYENYTFFEDD